MWVERMELVLCLKVCALIALLQIQLPPNCQIKQQNMVQILVPLHQHGRPQKKLLTFDFSLAHS